MRKLFVIEHSVSLLNSDLVNKAPKVRADILAEHMRNAHRRIIESLGYIFKTHILFRIIVYVFYYVGYFNITGPRFGTYAAALYHQPERNIGKALLLEQIKAILMLFNIINKVDKAL